MELLIIVVEEQRAPECAFLSALSHDRGVSAASVLQSLFALRLGSILDEGPAVVG